MIMIDKIIANAFVNAMKEVVNEVGEDVVRFAEKEGLQAHGRAVSKRLKK